MDFHPSEELVDVADLARAVLDDLASTERVREVEQDETRHDAHLWESLGKAGLLGLALPEAHGGAGLGLEAACVVLEEQGRHVAPVAVWPHVVAALALADAGTAEQQALLSDVAEGRVRLTLALEEADGAEPAHPRTTAVPGPDGRWLLSGSKAVVPAPVGSDHVLVSASTMDGPGLFLVATTSGGWEFAETTSHDMAGQLRLADTPGVPVGVPGDGTLATTLRRAAIALAALQVGVADGAMRLAAAYVSERVQFGRPLGSFQAVQHQFADCWIDIDAMRVTVWEALSRDLEADTAPVDAERSALVATWWRTKAGLDVVHRVQHVHGGIGVDVDYPSHRYFLWGKQLATTLGGSAAALADLGALVAREQVVS